MRAGVILFVATMAASCSSPPPTPAPPVQQTATAEEREYFRGIAEILVETPCDKTYVHSCSPAMPREACRERLLREMERCSEVHLAELRRMIEEDRRLGPSIVLNDCSLQAIDKDLGATR